MLAIDLAKFTYALSLVILIWKDETYPALRHIHVYWIKHSACTVHIYNYIYYRMIRAWWRLPNFWIDGKNFFHSRSQSVWIWNAICLWKWYVTLILEKERKKINLISVFYPTDVIDVVSIIPAASTRKFSEIYKSCTRNTFYIHSKSTESIRNASTRLKLRLRRILSERCQFTSSCIPIEYCVNILWNSE